MVKFAVCLMLLLGLLLPALGLARTPLQKVVDTYSSWSIASIDLYSGWQSI